MMRTVRLPWRALMLVSLWACPSAWAQGKPGIAITFEQSAVAASGLSPGRTVVWFGVERQVDAEYSSALFQHYQVGTVAADRFYKDGTKNPLPVALINGKGPRESRIAGRKCDRSFFVFLLLAGEKCQILLKPESTTGPPYPVWFRLGRVRNTVYRSRR